MSETIKSILHDNKLTDDEKIAQIYNLTIYKFEFKQEFDAVLADLLTKTFVCDESCPPAPKPDNGIAINYVQIKGITYTFECKSADVCTEFKPHLGVGKYHGKWSKSCGANLMQVREYQNGLEIGTRICYKYNKQNGDRWILQETAFADGVRHGVRNIYYENGQLSRVINYIYGIKDGPEIHYFPNGDIKVKKNWKGGFPHGEFKEYNINGIAVYSANYGLPGTLTGNFETRHSCGVVKTHGNYNLNGERFGNWVHYSAMGNIKTHLVYDNFGRLLKTTQYDNTGKIICSHKNKND